MTTPVLTLPLPDLASQFNLRRDIVFLNHGSFGACPRPVIAAYRKWQDELESEPVHFFGRRRLPLLAEARAALGKFVNADADDVVFVPNITYGMNIVINSLRFGPDDEILTTDHEYGAINNTWEYHLKRYGGKIVYREVPIPMTTPEAFIEHFWAGVTPNTKAISISHITSATALIFPIAEIIKRARAAGILSIIDGAHVPGHIDLDLTALDPDFYAANCHKWLCAPKGAGFLYARRDKQDMLEPFVCSWNLSRHTQTGSRFTNLYENVGTNDPAPWLAVPAAIEFQHAHNWPAVRAACHALGSQIRQEFAGITGLTPVSDESNLWWNQMALCPVPTGEQYHYHRLWEEFQIEIPVVQWHGHTFLRVAIQAYNTPNDGDRLIEAVKKIINR
jgi:isopenicillin-N epimerase